MDISIQDITPVAAVTASTKMGFNKGNNESYSSSIEERAAIEQAPGENADIWSELAAKYDIRNSSFNELCEVSARLYQAGQIYLFDYAMLTFDPDKSTQPVKPDIYITEANAGDKRDWIVEYEARAVKALKMNNKIGSKVIKNILKILERLKK